MVDYILEMAKVEDRIVAPEELALPPVDAAAESPKLSFTPSEEPETVQEDHAEPVHDAGDEAA